MSHVDVIRAWKDPDYRRGLSEAQLAELPANPAGDMALTNEQLKEFSGGKPIVTTAITCTRSTFLGWKACCP